MNNSENEPVEQAASTPEYTENPLPNEETARSAHHECYRSFEILKAELRDTEIILGETYTSPEHAKTISELLCATTEHLRRIKDMSFSIFCSQNRDVRTMYLEELLYFSDLKLEAELEKIDGLMKEEEKATNSDAQGYMPNLEVQTESEQSAEDIGDLIDGDEEESEMRSLPSDEDSLIILAEEILGDLGGDECDPFNPEQDEEVDNEE
ncbi:hypothetical protein KQI84_18700 [bacterium]|nr:hypothetical protein [bacterium]